MLNVNAGCWYGLFLDAYTYSTKYLIFTVTVIITSIFFVWIYEKPSFYRLLFKISKHSTIVSPIESCEEIDSEYHNSTLFDDELTTNQERKKDSEVEPESRPSH
ncbi:hypothetical protein SFRURICE_012295 [Spodoptera frugiperda]|uniref:SFRICE_017351 n=1 Tax=Spodoptera frugiperda TaxID=7108 RepID=A0A2H1VX85_SPOFR|nr:hypothetical protein SFRURICE_012295 [Spodoptera frugiperda]